MVSNLGAVQRAQFSLYSWYTIKIRLFLFVYFIDMFGVGRCGRGCIEEGGGVQTTLALAVCQAQTSPATRW